MKDNLRNNGVEIYTPSKAEYDAWRKLGEEVWETDIGKSVDKSMVDKGDGAAVEARVA